MLRKKRVSEELYGVQPSTLKEPEESEKDWIASSPHTTYVRFKSTGSSVSWDAWIKDLTSYQHYGIPLPPVEFPALKCKYCGEEVPKDANPETWAGHHIKRHKEAVKELTEKKLPWSAGLVVEETMKEKAPEAKEEFIRENRLMSKTVDSSDLGKLMSWNPARLGRGVSRRTGRKY